MNSPTAPFKVRLIWSGKDFDEHRLSLVGSEVDGVEDEKTWQGTVADWLTQIVYQERRNVDFAVKNMNIARFHTQRFFYLDVGCWLNSKHYFGVVCGYNAAVCNFDAGWAPTDGFSGPDAWGQTVVVPPAPASTHGGALFKDFMGHYGQRDSLFCQSLYPWGGWRDPNRLYVILPDIHLPQAISQIFQDDPKYVQRWDEYHNWLNPPFLVPDGYGIGRDLFNSLSSVGALTEFLTLLANFKGKFPKAAITLVQIGDLYELWRKRDRRFEPRDNEIVLVSPGVDPFFYGDRAREVGEWISGTHFLHQELFQAFDECQSTGIECIFLHGNHDNYLSVPAVVDAANRWQSNLCGACGMTPGYTPTRVHQGRKHHFKDQIFFEHGQRVDVYNRDGATAGHENCNEANEFWKAFDPVRRESFVTGAAAMHVRKGPDLGLYVMGHTHTPELRLVEISHARRDGDPATITGTDGARAEKDTPIDLFGLTMKAAAVTTR